MRPSFIAFASTLLSIAGPLATAGVARAADVPPATAAPAAPAARASEQAPDEDEGDADDGFKHVSIGINPLSVLIGRYSVQGEYLPTPHHAITLNPFYTHTAVKVDGGGQEIDGGSLNGFGAELGYRLYTGSKGPNGFFVGPSFLFASYTQSAATGTNPSGSEGSNSFTSYGGAIDIGGQAVIGPGIVIGGGFGLQYTKTSREFDTDKLNLASAIIASDGIRPRFLFSLGYAF